jgi:hypothetical protein
MLFSTMSLNKMLFMKLAIVLVFAAIASCKKADSDSLSNILGEISVDRSGNCPEVGTIKKGIDLGLWCKETLFIEKPDKSIIQPVISQHLMDGFSEGDQVTFGYREVFVAMISCGENVKTAELLCVELSKKK